MLLIQNVGVGWNNEKNIFIFSNATFDNQYMLFPISRPSPVKID
jgi:hypothetical protein